MDVSAAREALKALGVTRLLAKPEANPKLKKSYALGVLSAPLHFAPARLSGFEMCAMRSAGCTAGCLHTAGNPAHMQGKARARIAKSRAFMSAREAFMICLVDEIEKLEKKADKMGFLCGVRLNATSDIPFEHVPVTHNGAQFASIMLAFPRVHFYDYTARHNRRNIPANYSLTYSLKEANDARAIEAFQSGLNIAAVFNVKRGKPLPEVYTIAGKSLPVIDGDLHDFRPFDPSGFIVGLRAKGRAIGDRSGFVRSV